MIGQDAARRVRLVGLDVDGVLTDGGIYLGSTGSQSLEFKRYDIQDGLGIRFLKDAGIHVAIVTGRESESVRLRAAELDIQDVEQDFQARKLPAFLRILDRHGLSPEDTAYVGDDIPDLPILRVVGLPAAVANAVPEVRAAASVHLSRRGGHGAIREFAELLLRVRGEWEDVIARYLAARSGSMEPVQ